MQKETESNVSAKSNFTKSIIKWMWISFVGFVVMIALLFVLIYNGVVGYMPPIEELKNPTDNFASMIFTSDGVEMGRFYHSKSNRVYVDFDDIHQ